MNRTAKPFNWLIACIICLGWGLLAGNALADNIRADDVEITVLEKGNRKPVEGATVIVNQQWHQNTDRNGHTVFKQVLLPPLSIKVIAGGYDILSTTIDKNRQTLYLMPVMIGRQIIVSADRIGQKTSKHSLPIEELKKIPGTGGDPLKAIQALPGVVAAGEGTGNVYIRGSDQGDNGVWVNGIPVAYLYHFGDLSTINADLVEDFNLFLGGFPVSYPDHIGGFLDVKLRKPKQDRLHQNYRVAINEAAFLLEGPTTAIAGGSGFYVAARRSYADALFSPQELTDRINGDSKKDPSLQNEIITVPVYHDVQALWRRDNDSGHMLLQYLNTSDEIALLNNAARETSPELAGIIKANSGYHSLGAAWMQQWNARWQSKMTLSFDVFHSNRSLGSDPITGGTYFINRKDRSLRWQPELSWWRQNSQIRLGLEGQYTQIPLNLYISVEPTENDVGFDFTREEKFRLRSRINARLWSPYISYHYQRGGIEAQLGIRYSSLRASGGISMQGLAPRIRLRWQINASNEVSLIWGRYLQIPATTSQLLKGFGNPSLPFTDSHHRIVGYRHRLNPLWEFGAEIYHKPIEDLSVRVDNRQPPQNFVAAGIGEAYGAELSLRRMYKHRKSFMFSYSYGKSNRHNKLNGEKRDFSGDIPHSLNFLWTGPFRGGWRMWSWGLKLQARSGRPYTPITGRTAYCFQAQQYTPCSDQTQPLNDASFSYFVPGYGRHNSMRFDDFISLDFRLDREILYNRWKMNFYLDFQNADLRKNIIGWDYGRNYARLHNPNPIYSDVFKPFFGIEFAF